MTEDEMPSVTEERRLWRLIVVGGHTRSIGKTQLVCDVIRAFPETEWIAGKITQYGHGVCARNGENCDCAPDEHVCALDWETNAGTGTDSARFLEAGATRSFWLRTKQGYLAEGLPLLRQALQEVASGEWRVAGKTQEENGREAVSDRRPTTSEKGTVRDIGMGYPIFDIGYQETAVRDQELSVERDARLTAVIVESNSLMQFVKPSLYFAVIDPMKEDFKESAQMALDRAQALVLRGEVVGEASPAPLWMNLPAQLMREKPSVIQREGEPLPVPLWELVHRMIEAAPSSRI